jgi:hypothetical protein
VFKRLAVQLYKEKRYRAVIELEKIIDKIEDREFDNKMQIKMVIAKAERRVGMPERALVIMDECY